MILIFCKYFEVKIVLLYVHVTILYDLGIFFLVPVCSHVQGRQYKERADKAIGDIREVSESQKPEVV